MTTPGTTPAPGNSSADSGGTAPILYLGDTLLEGAASYLAGVMHHAGLAFDYVPSDVSALPQLQAGPRQLIILSDYPANTLPPEAHDLIAKRHQEGAGLLMLGGWESYHGLGGDWDQSPVADLLPVVISDTDDRINHDQPAYVCPAKQASDHAITADLPWDACPPVVGGYNRFAAKPAPGSTTLLNVHRQRVQREGDSFAITDTAIDPMLVICEATTSGGARTACLATDAAPHWVGPMVDWGTDNNVSPSGGGRVDCHAPGAEAVQVGQHYAQFFTQLVKWTMSV